MTFKRSKLLALPMLLLFLASSIGSAYAFGPQSNQSHGKRHNDRSQLDIVLTPFIKTQNQQAQFRSRSEVMREIKRRYDAKVLKISLNKKREIYNVRVLMPSGKVRNIQVSARR